MLNYIFYPFTYTFENNTHFQHQSPRGPKPQNLPPPTNIKPHRFPFLLSFQGWRRGFLHTLWAYSILTTSQFEIKYLRWEGGYSLSNQRKIFFPTFFVLLFHNISLFLLFLFFLSSSSLYYCSLSFFSLFSLSLSLSFFLNLSI